MKNQVCWVGLVALSLLTQGTGNLSNVLKRERMLKVCLKVFFRYLSPGPRPSDWFAVDYGEAGGGEDSMRGE